ncbi:MAG: aldo/keto reductase [Clostridia bacterium]|nr:aldo/keto reductase [Clostridia bacterium]
MIYKEHRNLKLSELGMGCMRLPVTAEDPDTVDLDAVKQMAAYAMEKGINYYDTAWGYHGGMSEIIMGEVLKEYPRDSFYLADKFPGYDLSNMDKVKEIFEKQLEKCQVDYFDYYMFHNVCELNVEAYLDPKYGILDYLLEQKRNGRIRHLGFSAHGACDTLRRFLDAYGEHMEFCQIQLNWMDWTMQNAREKVTLLNEYHMPIWVMEPLRGGKLVMLEEKHAAKLKALHPDEPVSAWSFRFLQSIPGVTMVLSGMSSFDQLQENIATFETEEPLNDEEKNVLFAISAEMISKGTLPCTACRYCTDHCPMELDIPGLIALYNDHTYTGGGLMVPMAVEAMPENKRPSACIGCQSCEAVCPQNIGISKMMTDFSEIVKL